jgi:magnesium and cobalt exporter, CNNM family
LEEGSSTDPDPANILQALSSSEILMGELLVPILGILTLLVLSGLVSGSEVAYFSLKSDDLDQLQKSKKKGDKRVLHLLKNPKQLLGAILILNNFINVAIVMISTFWMWKILGTRHTGGMILGAATITITFLIVFFGEITPKVYASQNNLQFAKLTSGLLKLASKIFKPAIFVLLGISNVIEKRFKAKGYKVTRGDLEQALEMTSQGIDTEEEKEILKGILNFSSVSVRQIMKSRMDIIALDIEENYSKVLKQMKESGYSRIPVFKETMDQIKGILYIKDLIPHLKKGNDFYWQNLIRPAFFVPESKKIDDLLRNFQNKRVHIALVVDEYGGTAGLVTMEDVIEEIVGEFNDEYDSESSLIQTLSENTFEVESKISLYDFCKALEVDESIFEEVRGESDSLGGLLLELFSKFPSKGDHIAFKNFQFDILSADKKRIKKVKVTINAGKEHAT